MCPLCERKESCPESTRLWAAVNASIGPKLNLGLSDPGSQKARDAWDAWEMACASYWSHVRGITVEEYLKAHR